MNNKTISNKIQTKANQSVTQNKTKTNNTDLRVKPLKCANGDKNCKKEGKDKQMKNNTKINSSKANN